MVTVTTPETRLTHNGYEVPIKFFGKKKITKTISDLTYRPKTITGPGDEIRAYRYSKCGSYIILPRFYGERNFGKPGKVLLSAASVKIPFKGWLRTNQSLVVSNCLKGITKTGGGLLTVGCGFGKTVCAIYLAHRLSVKTLIVVHKGFLLDQWVERVRKYTGLKNIGIVQQKEFNTNEEITIGTIQTITKRKRPFKDFGFVIYDEAHHLSCRTFVNALFLTNAKYLLALSATPTRVDGTMYVVLWFTGGFLHKEKLSTNQAVAVRVINYSSDNFRFEPMFYTVRGKRVPNIVGAITSLCGIDDSTLITRGSNVDVTSNLLEKDVHSTSHGLISIIWL